VQITATPLANYIFDGWSGSGSGNYTGSNTIANVIMNGNITETAYFSPFAVEFTENVIPVGAKWNLTFNGVLLSSTTNTITAYANNGNYFYDPNPTNTIGTVVSYVPYNYILPNTILPYSAGVSVNNANVVVYIPYIPFYPIVFNSNLGAGVVGAGFNASWPGGYDFQMRFFSGIGIPIAAPYGSTIKYNIIPIFSTNGNYIYYPSPSNGTVTVNGPTQISTSYTEYLLPQGGGSSSNALIYGQVNVNVNTPLTTVIANAVPPCGYSTGNLILDTYKNSIPFGEVIYSSFGGWGDATNGVCPNRITIPIEPFYNMSGNDIIIPWGQATGGQSGTILASAVPVSVTNGNSASSTVFFNSNTAYEITLNINQPSYLSGQESGEILDLGMPGSPPIIYVANYYPLYVPPGTYSYTAMPLIINNTTTNIHTFYGCLPYDKYGSVTVSGNTNQIINYKCWMESSS